MRDCPRVSADYAALEPNKRVNYVFGMVLGVNEFWQEQEHFEWKHRLSNLFLHGYGTVSGLQVSAQTLLDGTDVEIRISPGYAISPQGKWIWVEDAQCGRLNPWLQQHSKDLSPPLRTGPHTLYVTLCYDQCLQDLVPVASLACALDEDTRALSRILETFNLQFAWQRPLQPLEDYKRALCKLLQRVQITADPGTADDSELLLYLVRNIDRLASPPVVIPPRLQIPADTACDTLRRAYTVWVTEVCPRLLATQEDCLLLACVTFNLDARGHLIPGSVKVDDCERPVLVPGGLNQPLITSLSEPVKKELPYISSWLVLGPIFDPAHQFGTHYDDRYPRAGDIIRDIDNHTDQLDPVAITQTLTKAPNQGERVSYGGQGADGKMLLSQRVYTWRKRCFEGIDWNSISDIGDAIHTHLSGDYEDDPFDPHNYLNFAGKHHVLAFFLVYILSPDNRNTTLRLRHDDSLRVWLNGREIKKTDEKGNVLLPYTSEYDIIDEGEIRVDIPLRQGSNILLAAVAETHVEWGFSARIENYENLRFTPDNLLKEGMVAYKSTYDFISIAGAGNGWNPSDPNRTLSCVGNSIWKGRVKMLNEQYKFVANGDWNSWNWGADGKKGGPNFEAFRPAGIYEVIFNQNEPANPTFILVKPFNDHVE